MRAEIQGGVLVLVDDAGTCPPGRHAEGDLCVRDPTYHCEAKPGACGPGQLDCTCASSLCSSLSSCSYTCKTTTTDQVNCLCQVP